MRGAKDNPSLEVAALKKQVNALIRNTRARARVTERVLLPRVLAATATYTYPLFVAPCDLDGLAITIVPGEGVTGDDTNRKNLNVVNITAATELANYDLVTGDNLTNDVPYHFSLSKRTLKVGEVLGIEVEKVAAGVLTPEILVMVSYLPTAAVGRRALLCIQPHAAADATTPYPVFAAPVTLSTLRLRMIPGAAVTGVVTDNKHLNVIQYNTSGGGATELANLDLGAGTNLVKGSTYSFALSSSLNLTADRPLKFEVEQVGSGLILPPMLVIVDYVLATEPPTNGLEYLFLLVSPTAAADVTKQAHLIYQLGVALAALGVTMYPAASVTGAATNNKHFNLIGGSAGTTELDAYDLESGTNFTAMDAQAFVLVGTEKIVAPLDNLKLEVEKIGSGILVGATLVMVAYYPVLVPPALSALHTVQ